MTLLWLFWQILISYCKFLMPRPLKWSILGAHTIILSKNIHKVTKTDHVWFEFFMDQTLFLMTVSGCVRIVKNNADVIYGWSLVLECYYSQWAKSFLELYLNPFWNNQGFDEIIIALTLKDENLTIGNVRLPISISKGQ